MNETEAWHRYFRDPEYTLDMARRDGLTDDEYAAILAEADDEGHDVK